ncbi:MAG: fibronectin type III domain-containing protein [Bacillota bacterium]|nr:fibronectin type III domain-containing protein [Bacillota bacterium]
MKRIVSALLIWTMLLVTTGIRGAPVFAVSKPAVPAIISITSGTTKQEGEVTVKWKKISANGYQLQYSMSAGFSGAGTWSTKSASAVTRTFTGLNKGAVYYFRVRAIKQHKGKKYYSGWSSAVQITTHEHEFSSHVIEPAACNKQGTVEYSCNGCGYSYREELNGLEHSYEKKVSKRATTKSGGIMKYTCKRCGDCYTETISRLPAKNYTKKKAKTSTKSGNSKSGKATAKTQRHDKSASSVRQTSKRGDKQTEKQTPKAAQKPKVNNANIDSAKETSEAASSKPCTAQERTVKARKAAVSWAISIADNNEFHYGKSKWAHKAGCYYCGTNQRAGSSKRRGGASLAECAKTYCCNPFVTAAYYHGAGASEVNCKVKSKRINLANDKNKALKNKKAFKRISKPGNIRALCEGDILLTPTHCMLYTGDGKVVHAAHHDNGKRDSYWDSSIVHEDISSRQWKRTSKIYRYIGTGRY